MLSGRWLSGAVSVRGLANQALQATKSHRVWPAPVAPRRGFVFFVSFDHALFALELGR